MPSPPPISAFPHRLPHLPAFNISERERQFLTVMSFTKFLSNHTSRAPLGSESSPPRMLSGTSETRPPRCHSLLFPFYPFTRQLFPTTILAPDAYIPRQLCLTPHLPMRFNSNAPSGCISRETDCFPFLPPKNYPPRFFQFAAPRVIPSFFATSRSLTSKYLYTPISHLFHFFSLNSLRLY